MGGAIIGVAEGPFGVLGGAVGGGLLGAINGFKDKYQQCHP
ncbi:MULTISPECIES: hypothetical protein [unclassified Bartonella]